MMNAGYPDGGAVFRLRAERFWVSFMVINSLMRHNPARQGTPGGISDAAIYNNGSTFSLEVCGGTLTEKTADEGGGGAIFVSSDLSGTLRIDQSHLSNIPCLGFDNTPGIYALAGDIETTDSVIE
jgi:hypothetical protein